MSGSKLRYYTNCGYGTDLPSFKQRPPIQRSRSVPAAGHLHDDELAITPPGWPKYEKAV